MDNQDAKQKLANDIRGALAKDLKRAMSKPCILCGASSTNAHIWLPTPEHTVRHGGDPNKLRVYCYGVCDTHDPAQMHLFESKELIQQRIDQVIRDKLKAG